MALKAIVETKEEIPEGAESFYEEVEGKEYNELNRDTSNDPFKGTDIEGKD